jgi:hypothetical protein
VHAPEVWIFHDRCFVTLLEVIDHYDGHLQLNLTDAIKKNLVE